MIEVIRWLQTDDGRSLIVAVVGLINALTLYVTLHNQRQIRETKKLVNGHLAQHVVSRPVGDPTSSGLTDEHGMG